MGNKYLKVVDELDQLDIGRVDYQVEQIIRVVKSLEDAPMDDLLKSFYLIKELNKAFDAVGKKLSGAVELFNKTIVPRRMDDLGVDLMRVPEIGKSFSKQTKYSASIVPEYKDDAFEWLRKRGDGDLIIETVNASQLAAYARGLIVDEGIDLPEELFNVRTYNTTGINSYNPK